MRVLDLGCGSGRDLDSWAVNSSDVTVGLDIEGSRLALAKMRFPNRIYVQGDGEFLPFANESFDRVISAVALPYMNIQKALAEIHRILVPGGGLSLSLHLPSFTIAELLHNAVPRPVPTVFRIYVLANGLLFHCSGKTVGLVKGRTESFQTPRGMRIALKCAGFVSAAFTRAKGIAGERFLVEARKPVIGSSERASQVHRAGRRNPILFARRYHAKSDRNERPRTQSFSLVAVPATYASKCT